MQVVVVKFLDSATFSHWSTLDDLEKSKPRLCLACGFLWSDNDDVVRVGLLTSGDKQAASDWITIPSGCVKSVEVIREVDWADE